VVYINKINRSLKIMPYANLVSRLVGWVVPGLVGGATGNSMNLLVWSVYVYMTYGFVKFSVYPFIYGRVICLALGIATKKSYDGNRGSSSSSSSMSGTTATNKFRDFRFKMNMVLVLIAGANAWNLYLSAVWIFFSGPQVMSDVAVHVMTFRGAFALTHAVMIEILYFGIVERAGRTLRRCKGWAMGEVGVNFITKPSFRRQGGDKEGGRGGDNGASIENVTIEERAKGVEGRLGEDKIFSTMDNPLRKSNLI